MDVDDFELRRLEADWARIPAEALDEAEKVGDRAALNIKKDWARRWSGHAHIPALPRAVTYDRRHTLGALGWEIGPDKNLPQGPLGNVIEFGTRNNPPIPGGLPAARAEEPRMEAALADVLERVVTDGR